MDLRESRSGRLVVSSRLRWGLASTLERYTWRGSVAKAAPVSTAFLPPLPSVSPSGSSANTKSYRNFVSFFAAARTLILLEKLCASRRGTHLCWLILRENDTQRERISTDTLCAVSIACAIRRPFDFRYSSNVIGNRCLAFPNNWYGKSLFKQF